LDQINSFPFQGTEEILDIGSGDGEITSLISRKTNGTTTGIDIDSSMISHAKSHYELERLKFKRENGSEIEFKNKFDLVTSFNAAQWIGNQLEFLQRVHTALKPGGRILFGMPTIVAHEAIGTSLMVSIFRQVSSSEKWNVYFREFKSPWHFFSKGEYQDLLSQAGFKTIRVSVTKKPFKLANVASFIAWMRQISPHLKYIPDHHKDEFLNEVALEYLKQVPLGNQGEVRLSHAQLEVYAARDEKPN
jgi:trans-aconitate methyltransferase